MNIYNFQRKMRGMRTLHLWHVLGQRQSHHLLNPYKTTDPNFNFKTASSIEICFPNTFGCSIQFPPDLPRRTIPEISVRRRKTLDTFKEELENITERDPLHRIQPE